MTTPTPNPNVTAPPDTDDALDFQPGDLAPVWAGPFAPATLSPEAENALVALCRAVGNKDTAARRWEVEAAWEMRLYDRGYQTLLPRRGGGWVVPPYAAIYNQTRTREFQNAVGYETNIIGTYGEIVTAALTRDAPHVRFEPADPMSDADVTAADAAECYKRLFAHQNDLKTFQQQLVYYLRTDGRAVVCVDYILDAQRFGREQVPDEPDAVPEDSGAPAVFYVMRHGETGLNRDGLARGRSEVPLDSLGQSQAEQAADWLKSRSVGAVVSSPVERARESAQVIAQIVGASMSFDDRLASFDIGDLSGQDAAALKQTFADARRDPNEPVGGTGESWDEFSGRVQALLAELTNTEPGAQSAPPVLVTHDSFIRAAAEALNGEGGWLDGMVGPGGVAVCERLDDGSFRLRPVYPSAAPLPPSHRTRPRGREVVSCFGKLEAHVPINCNSLDEMPFVQIAREYDVAIAKAMFPKKADKITPGGGGVGGESELDRIARINANLALESSFVTGDSQVRDVTIRRTFFRPSAFMEVSDQDCREELFGCFPDGCEVIMAGSTFIQATNCAMDDHLSVVQAYPGSGQNRMALCTKLLPVQKRLNTWLNLLHAYFTRTVPNRYVDAKMLDVQALTDQPPTPGDYVGVLDPDGAPINPETTVFIEPTPAPQPAMPEFIDKFFGDYSQLLSGSTPTLFGSLSNTDTPVGTVSIQRDMALGRLGTTWHAISEATCRYFLQAVQLAARCRTEDIHGSVEGDTIHIELSEMKGKCVVRPENDANFPESWSQRQFRYTQLMQDATNPLVGKLLTHPQNQRIGREAIGLEGFVVPDAAAYEKQLGEFDELKKSGPQPNPAKQQAVAAAQQAVATGNPAAQQLMQQIAQLPDEISSVPVDKELDLHEAEFQACSDLLNGPEGRRMKNGTQRERAAYANIRLHALEHKANISKPASDAKPPSISINYRDLPPIAAAEALERAGVPAPPQSVASERVQQTQLKRAAKTPAE